MNLRTYVGKQVTLHNVTGRVVSVLHSPEGGVTVKLKADSGRTIVTNLANLQPLLVARMHYLENQVRVIETTLRKK